MNIEFDKDLIHQSVPALLEGNMYSFQKYSYDQVSEFHEMEELLIADLNKILLHNVKLTHRIIVIFRLNTQSKLFRQEELEWLLLRISARFIFSRQLLWSIKEDDDFTQNRLGISLHVPVKTA